MKSTAPSRQSRPADSILSPVIDFLCVGGLSLIVLRAAAAQRPTDLVLIGAGAQAWIATVDQHAALHGVVPARLPQPRDDPAAQVGVDLRAGDPARLHRRRALGGAVRRRSSSIILVSVSSAYLAWHYTGQVWGMMASYAYLDGTRLREDGAHADPHRAADSARVARDVVPLHAAARSVARAAAVHVVSAGTLVGVRARARSGLARCGGGPASFRRRARSWRGWRSSCGTRSMARDPKAIFWIQIAHALQYLAFPIRVELNRTAERCGAHQRRGWRCTWRSTARRCWP